MNLAKKIAAAAGALTLGATGIAAAAGPPPAAHDGLTNASEHVGVEVPASKHAHAGADGHADDASDPDEGPELDREGGGLHDNHGAEVSAVAKSDATTGREHGMAVSEVARHGHGHGPSEDRAADHP